ncbi:hypothetical protein QZH41_007468 [Actinostola sp. cb2023]|nr:hypothetical protein QZH41_007468 [Actinostola sp. cb2023]
MTSSKQSAKLLPEYKAVDDKIRTIYKEIIRSKLNLETNETLGNSLEEYAQKAKKERTKIVFFYTAFFGQKPWNWMRDTKMFNTWEGIQCPYFRCRLTYSIHDFLRADAVVFHAKDMPVTLGLYRLLHSKPKAQKWVYFALESPKNNPKATPLNSLFHWTLTYRRDSDFYSPYGYYYPITSGQDEAAKTIESIIKKKDKFIFWAASHCGIFRDKYIHELLQHVAIDVYGKCGPFVGINKTGECYMNDPKCTELMKRHKFLLAFENSYCEDYITEKYWNAIKLGIVPVVLGGANYSNPALAIPGSFIDVMAFKTIQKLAEFLVYLDKNDEAYAKYFEWRKHYKQVDYAPWTCVLCATLNMNTKKTYIADLDDFWSIEGQFTVIIIITIIIIVIIITIIIIVITIIITIVTIIITIIIVITIIITIIIIIIITIITITYSIIQTSSHKKPMKTVLAYTAFFHEKPWGWMNGTDRFNLWEGIACPYFRCKLSFDNSEFRSADAVLFHSKDLPGRVEMFRLAKQKPKKQKWVYFALESPMFNPDAKWLNNLFHYTLTYRRDSDFYSPYGYFYRVTNGVKNEDSTIRKILRKKDHFVFWASSHCAMPREKFIKQLLKHIKIDVYGKCAGFVGTKVAGDCKLDNPKCNKLRERYKFLLGFENSNCKDYITEKYWGALKLGIVPIVLGGGNYSNIDLAIPGSFINAMDFKSVKDLADHLVYLDRNEVAYSKYFEWRKTYKEVTYAPWTCQLCAALNMNTKPTFINRLSDFWSPLKQCHLTDKAINEIVKADH